MPSITVRDLPPDVHRRLRIRAARAGRSMEAEVRVILAEATAGEDEAPVDALDLQQWVASLYGPEKPLGVVDALIAQRRRESHSES